MKIYTTVTVPTPAPAPGAVVLSHELIARTPILRQWLGQYLTQSSAAGWDFEQSTDSSVGILFVFSHTATAAAGPQQLPAPAPLPA